MKRRTGVNPNTELTGYCCVSFILLSHENKLNVLPIFRMSGLFLVTADNNRESDCVYVSVWTVSLFRSVRALHCKQLAQCHAVILLLLFVLNWLHGPETDHYCKACSLSSTQTHADHAVDWRARSLSSSACILAHFYTKQTLFPIVLIESF